MYLQFFSTPSNTKAHYSTDLFTHLKVVDVYHLNLIMSDVVMMSKHVLLLQSSNSLNPINILEKDLANMTENLRVRKTC